MANLQTPDTTNLSSLNANWGETKLMQETVSFVWQIKDYFGLTSDGKMALRSPIFDGNPTSFHKWQLKIRPRLSDVTGMQYISAHLYMVEFHLDKSRSAEPLVDKINVRFAMALLDADGNEYRPVGGKQAQAMTFQNQSGWGYDNWLLLEALRTNKSQLLPNGDLTIKCDLWMDIGIRHRISKGRRLQSEVASVEQLSLDVGKIFEEGVLSDVTVEVGPLSIPAHKAVLAARSPVFLAMFTIPMQESVTNVVKIEDFDGDVVKGMLGFLYTGKIAKEVITASAPDFLRIADKYNVEDLRETCINTIAENVTVDNAIDVLWLAETHSIVPLMNLVLNFMRSRRQDIMQTNSFRTFMTKYPHAFVQLFISQL